MSGLLSFFTVCSVFFPSSRAPVDQCQSSVCWGEMCVCWGGVLTRLSQLRGEAAAGWPLTSKRRSLSVWVASGGVVAPHARRKAAVGVRARNPEPPSCCFQHRHRPIDQPQEDGGGGGKEQGRRGESLISFSLSPSAETNYLLRTSTVVLLEERTRETVVEEILRYFAKVKVATQLCKNTPSLCSALKSLSKVSFKYQK